MRTKNVILAEKTTFQIGGAVEVFSIPEKLTNLLEEVQECRAEEIPLRIIGKGSNLLIADRGVSGHVVSLEECANSLDVPSPGMVRAGAGVPLSRFILFCIEQNLYGNEFLSSVPGTVGGAVVMNAGTWTDKNLYISDHLVSVEFFDGTKVRKLQRDECGFGYRTSVFQQKPHYIVLSALFQLPSQPKSVGIERRRDRLIWSREHQDVRFGNAGSVFSTGNGRILNLLMGVRLGRAGWSAKTGNWINNYGNASFRNVKALIRMGQFLHQMAGIRAHLEIRVWDK
jgi:UDP-N-acetylmuramate dehydrogenase